jgi:hypothetical protein
MHKSYLYSLIDVSSWLAHLLSKYWYWSIQSHIPEGSDLAEEWNTEHCETGIQIYMYLITTVTVNISLEACQWHSQSYWISGACPSSRISNNRNTTFRCFYLQVRGGRHLLLGPLERANFNHWTSSLKEHFSTSLRITGFLDFVHPPEF